MGFESVSMPIRIRVQGWAGNIFDAEKICFFILLLGQQKTNSLFSRKHFLFPHYAPVMICKSKFRI